MDSAKRVVVCLDGARWAKNARYLARCKQSGPVSQVFGASRLEGSISMASGV